jgi:hypothetical protein
LNQEIAPAAEANPGSISASISTLVLIGAMLALLFL